MLRWPRLGFQPIPAVVLASILSCAPAIAQAPPSAVNDCTFLREPLALRDCLDRAENQRAAPPTEEAGGPRRAPDWLLKEARPIAGSTEAKSGPEAPRPHAAERDRVRIEQVPNHRGRSVDPP